MTDDTMNIPGAPAIPAEPEPSGLRMVLTMAGIGLFCGILIVLTFQLTLPIITLNKARALEKAIFEVVPAATSKAMLPRKRPPATMSSTPLPSTGCMPPPR